jgi:hypothetical protein
MHVVNRGLESPTRNLRGFAHQFDGAPDFDFAGLNGLAIFELGDLDDFFADHLISNRPGANLGSALGNLSQVFIQDGQIALQDSVLVVAGLDITHSVNRHCEII